MAVNKKLSKLAKTSHLIPRGSERSSIEAPLSSPGVNLVELAQRIKQKRIERRLTIEQLATGTGLTRSWLSKVENFRVTPSLPALFRIAGSLGISLSELVEGLEEGPEICVVRAGEGKLIERDDQQQNNSEYRSLAHSRTSRSMDPFLLTIPAKGGRTLRLPHSGEEFLFVLEGTPAFDYGAETWQLQVGDGIYFNGSTPHRVYNPHDTPSRVLCVFLP